MRDRGHKRFYKQQRKELAKLIKKYAALGIQCSKESEFIILRIPNKQVEYIRTSPYTTSIGIKIYREDK